MDFIKLNGDITVSEIKLTEKLVGETVRDADLRQKYGLNIIALEREGETTIEVRPDYQFQSSDILVVIGKRSHVKDFEDYLSEE